MRPHLRRGEESPVGKVTAGGGGSVVRDACPPVTTVEFFYHKQSVNSGAFRVQKPLLRERALC